MQVIIIAALALIVLLILAFILTGKFRIFGITTRSCESFGGNCIREPDSRVTKKFGLLYCPEDHVTKRNTDCEDEDKYPTGAICCIPLTEEE